MVIQLIQIYNDCDQKLNLLIQFLWVKTLAVHLSEESHKISSNFYTKKSNKICRLKLLL